MRSSKELSDTFFSELKHFNNTNFKAIAKADLSNQDAAVHKAFSSVITRYFIFREKHPEISEQEFNMLYFALTLDLVATYFSEYPDTSTDNLVAFQVHLKRYIKDKRNKNKEEDASDEQSSSISDIGLESDNTMSVEQQQKSESVAV